MKSLLSLIAISFLSLLIVFAGCGSPVSTTSSPVSTTSSHSNTTSPPSVTTPSLAYINLEPCDNDPESKIVIDNVTVTSGTLDRDYYTPAAGQHFAGEPCFLFAGNIKNGYNEDCWVAYHIEGFDASANHVSSTLETGPLPGWGQVYLAAFSSMDFTLHLNWSDNVTGFLISSQRTTRVVPSPSPANISVNIEPCLDDSECKIVIYDVAVVAGTLDREYISREGIYEPGEPCWFVTGHISNGYDEKYWVAYHAHGFDASGNEVSFTLDAGPIMGVEQVCIYGRSFENITLHLSWADNVTSITLSSQMWNQMFP
jgi:acyl-CoA synthetase (AMP-forming)/AMP-acid ligase II